MPLGCDQKIGTVVWSPLASGRLTGKIRRDQPLPASSHLHKTPDHGPWVDNDYLYRVLDTLYAVAEETGKSVPQIALNWLLQRPTVSSIIIGARDEAQLRENLGAIGWNLTQAQIAKLDSVSDRLPPYRIGIRVVRRTQSLASCSNRLIDGALLRGELTRVLIGQGG
jgi:aryl-alcohol dehydrogenase-like predicted oxidoreductase